MFMVFFFVFFILNEYSAPKEEIKLIVLIAFMQICSVSNPLVLKHECFLLEQFVFSICVQKQKFGI